MLIHLPTHVLFVIPEFQNLHHSERKCNRLVSVSKVDADTSGVSDLKTRIFRQGQESPEIVRRRTRSTPHKKFRRLTQKLRKRAVLRQKPSRPLLSCPPAKSSRRSREGGFPHRSRGKALRPPQACKRERGGATSPCTGGVSRAFVCTRSPSRRNDRGRRGSSAFSRQNS